jgi:hypothetical protein
MTAIEQTPVSFDVTSDGLYFTNFTFGFSLPCSPSGMLTGSVTILPGARFGIQPDGSLQQFNNVHFTLSGAVVGTLTITLGGRFTGPRSAAGTLNLQASLTSPGSFECGPVADTWTVAVG